MPLFRCHMPIVNLLNKSMQSNIKLALKRLTAYELGMCSGYELSGSYNTLGFE